MKNKAEPRLARMAKKAKITKNFMPSIISVPRSRAFYAVTLATLCGVALTVRLGFWQLSRAAEKEQRQAQITTQMEASVLDTQALLTEPSKFKNLHQRVVLQGRWLPEYTVYLENRPMNGRTGFWVLTPLELNEDARVLVQRGWLPRHQLDRTLLPEMQTPEGVVQVQGRIALPPSDLMTFREREDKSRNASDLTQIRQNIEMDVYMSQVGSPLKAIVLQTDESSEGLLRDWPQIASGVEKNLAYAFQWFCLAALQLLLYIWFQFIQPYRHARRTSF
jgi:surfeit locus 1 family protein